MATRERLIVLGVLGLCSQSAFAAYASLKPPAGWSAPAAVGQRASYAAAANESWLSHTVRTSATLNVGGQSVKVPATMRLASNAGQFFTGRIGTAVGLGARALIPGAALTLAAMMVVPAVVDWLHQQDNIIWDPLTETFRLKRDETTFVCPVTPDVAAAQNYCVTSHTYDSSGWTGTAYPLRVETTVDTCKWIYMSDQTNGSFHIKDEFVCVEKAKTPITGPIDDPAPWPVPLPYLDPLPLGDDVPNGVPLPWPVDDPVINPSPSAPTVPRPLRVPTGNPVPTPDPAKWKQPWVEIVPSPTATDPWRVDVKPGETLQDSPTPMPDPITPPDTPDPNDTTKPEEQQSLCEKHPDIVACQKIELGTLEPTQVPDSSKPITMTPDAGWGRPGACPAPRTVNLHGGLTLSIPLDLMCEFASMIRPLILAAAYLGAALMLVGAARKD